MGGYETLTPKHNIDLKVHIFSNFEFSYIGTVKKKNFMILN